MSRIISVQHISKQYRIGVRRRHNSFRDAFAERVQRMFSRGDNGENVKEDILWALNDVSFDVEEGQVLGIIGRNGAGKSTLLKILSRITEPTTGRIEIRGRVSSLLEVGTGFSGELTGRENIFLNGAILGMRKNEIDRRFEEIVDFADIGRFVDTPVKHYSSGMYMRLAFAVAAHLEPDVLVVDEVLAVGDAQFQKKCLGKMQTVSRSGRTVMFVSHNMKAVRQLCSRAILLRNGCLIADGPSSDITERYLREELQSAASAESLQQTLAALPHDEVIRWLDIRLTQDGAQVFTSVSNGRPLEITITYLVTLRTTGLRIYCDVADMEETLLFRSFHDETAEGIPATEPGRYVSTVTIPAEILAPLNYELVIRAGIHNVRGCLPVEGIRIPISVEATGRYNSAYLGDTHRGKLALALKWETTRLNDAAR